MLRPLTAVLGLLLAVIITGGAQSREPAAPYGKHIAVSHASWPASLPDPGLTVFPDLDAKRQVQTPKAAEREAIRQLESTVRELESAGGPYAVGLEEPLGDLARQLVAQGRLAEALTLFQRSLHVLRINSGLSSPAQMTVLRSMLQLQRALGNREALADLYGYYYRLGWLAADDRGSDEPWQVALEYLRWQREQIRSEPRGDVDRELLALHGLNERLLEQAAEEQTAPSVRRELARSQLRNLYLLRDRVRPVPVSEPFSVLTRRRNRPPEMLSEDIYRDRLLSLWRSAVKNGSDLLAAQAARVESRVARAELYRDIGDWEQWNGTWRRAQAAWRRAFELLEEEGQGGLIQAWFGEPVELPDNGVFWQPDAAGDDDARVRITFDVSARGRARSVDAGVISGRDSASITAVRELRAVRFRPRFKGGEAVASKDVVREYQVYR